jgi:thioredoxin 1
MICSRAGCISVPSLAALMLPLSLMLGLWSQCPSAQGPIPAPTGLRLVETTATGPRSGLQAVSETDFDRLVLGSEQPVLVFCIADWSAPARTMTPIVERVSRDFDAKLRVMTLDTQASPALTNRYVISGIPYFLLFAHGELVGTKAGLLTREQLGLWIDKETR